MNDDLFDEMFYRATTEVNSDQRIEELEEENELLKEKFQRLYDWAEAYPVKVFPEPDLEKAAQVLKENGMTLDVISASNFRFLLNRVMEIANPSQ